MFLLFLLLLTAAQADDKAADEALDAFKAPSRSSSEADRAKAVTELAAVQHPKVAARLGGVLGSDAASVRIAAARGLGAFSDHKKAAATSLTGAIPGSLKDPLVAIAILEALGRLAEPSSLSALHKAFDEKDAGTAKAAVAAAGQIRSPSSIEPLIVLLLRLEKQQKTQQGGALDFTTPDGQNVQVTADEVLRKRLQELPPAVLQALKDITRESFPTGEAWSAWWSRSRATFKPAR